jgi:hypothetical protein
LIVVVTGSRSYKDQLTVHRTLDAVNETERIEVLLTGKCPKGPDNFAELWAVTNGVQLLLIPANWRGPHSTQAGHVRNGMLLDTAMWLANPRRPKLLAFASKCIKPNCAMRNTHWSHGTRDCVMKAKRLGVTVSPHFDHTLSAFTKK